MHYLVNKLIYLLVGKLFKKGQRRNVWHAIRLTKMIARMSK